MWQWASGDVIIRALSGISCHSRCSIIRYCSDRSDQMWSVLITLSRSKVYFCLSLFSNLKVLLGLVASPEQWLQVKAEICGGLFKCVTLTYFTLHYDLKCGEILKVLTELLLFDWPLRRGGQEERIFPVSEIQINNWYCVIQTLTVETPCMYILGIFFVSSLKRKIFNMQKTSEHKIPKYINPPPFFVRAASSVLVYNLSIRLSNVAWKQFHEPLTSSGS